MGGRRIYGCRGQRGDIPGIFSMIAATAGGLGITVTWNASLGATSYLIQRGTSPGVYSTLAAGVTSPYLDGTMTDFNVTYYYRIVAYNEAGQRTSTNEVSTALPQAKSVELDGLSEYLSAGDNFGFAASDAFSINCWVYPLEATPTGILIGKFNASYRGYGIEAFTGILFFGLANSNTVLLYKNTGTVLAQNQWQMVTFTTDGSQTLAGIKCYRQGVLESASTYSDSLAGNPITNTSPFALGGGDYPTFLQGYYDEPDVINAELTAAQVLELYHSGLPMHRPAHSRYSQWSEFWRNGDLSDVYNAIVGQKSGKNLNTINGDSSNIVSQVP